MSEERQTRYHGRGISSRWSKRHEARHYTVTYRWTVETEAVPGPKPVTANCECI